MLSTCPTRSAFIAFSFAGSAGAAWARQTKTGASSKTLFIKVHILQKHCTPISRLGFRGIERIETFDWKKRPASLRVIAESLVGSPHPCLSVIQRQHPGGSVSTKIFIAAALWAA